jgi:ribosomal protein S12 methylthiotransferase accessory factor
MKMEIAFPGGLAVDAHYHGFTIPTDQPVKAGGAGTAPAPFDLFLASIGTCAGLYALRFCQQRGIDTAGLGVTLTGERDDDHGFVSALRLELRLPDEFPEKYRDAIVRAVDQCTVKRHILHPPVFTVTVATAAEAVPAPV